MKRFNSLEEMGDVLCLFGVDTPNEVDVSQEELDWYIGYLPAKPHNGAIKDWYFRGIRLNAK